jgi:alcohol dehydrogenase (cytochrome c)
LNLQKTYVSRQTTSIERLAVAGYCLGLRCRIVKKMSSLYRSCAAHWGFRPSQAALAVTGVLAGILLTQPGLADAQAVFRLESYAPAAADRGQIAFAITCGQCHGADLTAGAFGPALKGAEFDAKWSGRDARALQAYIQATMPPASPGSLSSDAYSDIVAYIVRGNGGAPAAQSAGAPAQARPAQAPPGAIAGPPPRTAPADATAKAILAARKVKLDALSPVTQAMLENPADSDWLSWRRTYLADGFSNLSQINGRNVGTLQLAWSWNLPTSQNQMTPLIHDGVMFVQSGNVVQALDAATGDRLWQYIRAMPAIFDSRNTRAKTLAVYGDKLFAAMADKHVIALDIRTGALIWERRVIELTETERKGGADPAGHQLAGGPIVARGKVVVGASLGMRIPGGSFIIALDAETGREAWRFNTIARPGELGGDSWNGMPVEHRYGGGVWTSGSFDPKRNLFFFGIGNTYTVGGLLNHGAEGGSSNDALYTDSTVALDPDTGRLVWFYQHMNREVWDLDWAFERTLGVLSIDGRPKDVVITVGKLGVFDVIDRETGVYLFSTDLGVQNLLQSIDPKTGRKTPKPEFEPTPGKTSIICPGVTGARAWPATAFDQRSRIVYVPMTESCMRYSFTARTPEQIAAGQGDIGFPIETPPNSDGNLGRIQAVNLDTRKVVWTYRQRAPTSSSVLATAGGVVFAGSVDRRFSAYDAATGTRLWDTPLSDAPSSTPVTYSVAGVQYVAVVTGGGGSHYGDTHALVAEEAPPGAGITVMVYRLPK